MTKLKIYFILLFILLILLPIIECRHRRYRVHKDSSLAKFHIKTLRAWRRTYTNTKRHKRRRHHRRHHSNEFPFNDILNQMDSFTRPRFG